LQILMGQSPFKYAGYFIPENMVDELGMKQHCLILFNDFFVKLGSDSNTS